MCQFYIRWKVSTGYIHCVNHWMTVHYAKLTSLEGKSRPVYLIAVLMVLEACVVVHKTVEFLKALVLLLCLQNHDETPVTVNKLLSMLLPLTEECVGTLVESSQSTWVVPKVKSVLVIGRNADGTENEFVSPLMKVGLSEHGSMVKSPHIGLLCVYCTVLFLAICICMCVCAWLKTLFLHKNSLGLMFQWTMYLGGLLHYHVFASLS